MRLRRHLVRRSDDRPLALADHRTDRRRFRTVAVVAVSLALAGLVASCGSDDDSASSTTAPEVTLADATEGGETGATNFTTTTRAPVEPGTAEEYAAALLTSLTDDPDNARLMNETEAACIAPKWIESITPERFGAEGFAPDDLVTQRSMSAIVSLGLSVEEAEPLVAIVGDCGVDIRSRVLEAAMSEGDQAISEESRPCLEENLTSEVVDRMIAVTLSGDTEDPIAEQAITEFLGVREECGLIE